MDPESGGLAPADLCRHAFNICLKKAAGGDCKTITEFPRTCLMMHARACAIVMAEGMFSMASPGRTFFNNNDLDVDTI